MGAKVIEYVEASQIYATNYIRNSKAIAVLWAIFTICYSIIVIVSFVTPGKFKYHVDECTHKLAPTNLTQNLHNLSSFIQLIPLISLSFFHLHFFCLLIKFINELINFFRKYIHAYASFIIIIIIISFIYYPIYLPIIFQLLIFFSLNSDWVGDLESETGGRIGLWKICERNEISDLCDGKLEEILDMPSMSFQVRLILYHF